MARCLRPSATRPAVSMAARSSRACRPCFRARRPDIPKNIVTDGPVVTKLNADGMLWMQDQFLI